jgi:hypothetical protein
MENCMIDGKDEEEICTMNEKLNSKVASWMNTTKVDRNVDKKLNQIFG